MGCIFKIRSYLTKLQIAFQNRGSLKCNLDLINYEYEGIIDHLLLNNFHCLFSFLLLLLLLALNCSGKFEETQSIKKRITLKQ